MVCQLYPLEEMTPGQPKAIYTTRQPLVGMYHSAKHSLVWRALVSKTFDPKSKPEKRQKNLQKGYDSPAYPPSIHPILRPRVAL